LTNSKIILRVCTILTVLLGFILSAVPAQASSWHIGVPQCLEKHKLWANKKKDTSFDKNRFYNRDFFYFDSYHKHMNLVSSSILYFKNGWAPKNELSSNLSTYTSICPVMYKSIGKNNYQFKSETQMSGYSDLRFEVKKISPRHIKVWTKRLANGIDPVSSVNKNQKKWHKLGNFYLLKQVSIKSIDKMDPLHK